MVYAYTLILAIFGIILAYYIWYKKTKKEKLVCIFGKDCNRVLESAYGRTFGIDNTILGILYYVFIIIASLIAILYPVALGVSLFTIGFLILAGFAAAFSVYLTFVQLFVLKELCEYCLGSTIMVIIIFVISLI